jgi:hypothetical protein
VFSMKLQFYTGSLTPMIQVFWYTYPAIYAVCFVERLTIPYCIYHVVINWLQIDDKDVKMTIKKRHRVHLYCAITFSIIQYVH